MATMIQPSIVLVGDIIKYHGESASAQLTLWRYELDGNNYLRQVGYDPAMREDNFGSPRDTALAVLNLAIRAFKDRPKDATIQVRMAVYNGSYRNDPPAKLVRVTYVPDLHGAITLIEEGLSLPLNAAILQ